jgi:Rap guanine nucleotide exchange factor 4
VSREHYFKDKYLFYRFKINDESWFENTSKRAWEDQLQDTIILLAQLAPDATLRMILRKP